MVRTHVSIPRGMLRLNDLQIVTLLEIEMDSDILTTNYNYYFMGSTLIHRIGHPFS